MFLKWSKSAFGGFQGESRDARATPDEAGDSDEAILGRLGHNPAAKRRIKTEAEK